MLPGCFILKERWTDKKAYRVFAAKDIPLEMHDTIVDGRHLHYALTGSDSLPTLVFIHGSPGSLMHYMRYLYDTDLRKKFRMVSIDRPGFGYSNFGKAMHLADQCKIILPVLESLKKETPMFVMGHSMGGPIVVKLAAENPGLFQTIVIAAGAIDPDLEKKETWRLILKNRPLFWLMPGAFAPSNTELLYLKKDLVLLKDDFEKVTSNVVFIHGDADSWVPVENIDYGKTLLVNAKSISVNIVKGAGHQIPWKQSEAFKQILLSLVEKK